MVKSLSELYNDIQEFRVINKCGDDKDINKAYNKLESILIEHLMSNMSPNKWESEFNNITDWYIEGGAGYRKFVTRYVTNNLHYLINKIEDEYNSIDSIIKE